MKKIFQQKYHVTSFSLLLTSLFIFGQACFSSESTFLDCQEFRRIESKRTSVLEKIKILESGNATREKIRILSAKIKRFRYVVLNDLIFFPILRLTVVVIMKVIIVLS